MAGPVLPADPGALDDEELLRRWRRTGAELRGPWRGPAEASHLVETRHRLLDEMERRDPDRFSRWLTTQGQR